REPRIRRHNISFQALQRRMHLSRPIRCPLKNLLLPPSSPSVNLGLPKRGITIHAHHVITGEQLLNLSIHFRTRHTPTMSGRIPNSRPTTSKCGCELVTVQRFGANTSPVVNIRTVKTETNTRTVRHRLWFGLNFPPANVQPFTVTGNNTVTKEP